MKWISAIFLVFLIGSCSETTCLQGDPEAIFNDQLPGVKQHRFEYYPDQHKSEEYLLLDSNEALELWQSGCEHLRQEYRFIVPGPISQEEENDPFFWIATLLKRLDNLRKLGISYGQYGDYVRAIAERAENWVMGEPQELAPGFYATIDLIPASENNILMLILSDQP